MADKLEQAEKAEELIEKAEENTEELQEQHNALLEAVAEDEELIVEETEEVEIGDATITASTELTGDTLRKVDKVEEGTKISTAIDTAVDVLVDQTEKVEATNDGNTVKIDSNDDIRGFYRTFINTHDAEKAATLCFERVVKEPNELEKERREEVQKSFQKR
jgi:hypothetical protein